MARDRQTRRIGRLQPANIGYTGAVAEHLQQRMAVPAHNLLIGRCLYGASVVQFGNQGVAIRQSVIRIIRSSPRPQPPQIAAVSQKTLGLVTGPGRPAC